LASVRVLNGAPIRSKYTDATTLRAAGVPTVEVSQTRPADRIVPAAADPALAAWLQIADMTEHFPAASDQNVRSQVAVDAARQLAERVQGYLRSILTPAPAPQAVIQEDWLPRLNNHVGGNDLLRPPQAADYWSKKEALV